jgi:hypothetical protein
VEGMIPKLIAKLEDDDSDVRAATIAAVLALSARGWSFGIIYVLYLTFYAEPYQNGIKSSISMMINQMDNTNWSIREKTVQVLVKLAESGAFHFIENDLDSFSAQKCSVRRSILKESFLNLWISSRMTTRMFALQPRQPFEHSAPALMVGHSNLLESDDLVCLSLTFFPGLYHAKINLSIPIIIAQLDSEKWATRREAIRILAMLSEQGSPFDRPHVHFLTYFVSPVSRNDKDGWSCREIYCEAQG